MKQTTIAALAHLLEREVTVYTSGLRVKGVLFLINMDLRIIGLKPVIKEEEPLVIDIKSITAIQAADIGDVLYAS